MLLRAFFSPCLLLSLDPWREMEAPCHPPPGSQASLGAMAQSTPLPLQRLWVLAQAQRAQAGRCVAKRVMRTASYAHSQGSAREE